MSDIFITLVVIVLPVAFITIMVGSLVRDYLKLKKGLDQETLEAIETLERLEKKITEHIQVIDRAIKNYEEVNPATLIPKNAMIREKKAIQLAIRKLKEE